MSNFLISQILAIVAIFFDVVSFQIKSRKKIVFCLAVSAGLLAAHYFLLEKFVTGVLVLISLSRFFVAIWYQNKYVMAIFLVISTFATVYLYQSTSDLIAYTGILLVTVASFQKNDKYLRQIMMPGTLTFIIYNLIIGSFAGALVEGIFLTSNAVGYYRHYLRK